MYTIYATQNTHIVCLYHTQYIQRAMRPSRHVHFDKPKPLLTSIGSTLSILMSKAVPAPRRLHRVCYYIDWMTILMGNFIWRFFAILHTVLGTNMHGRELYVSFMMFRMYKEYIICKFLLYNCVDVCMYCVAVHTELIAQPSMFRGTLKAYQIKGVSWLVNLYSQVYIHYIIHTIHAISTISQYTQYIHAQ